MVGLGPLEKGVQQVKIYLVQMEKLALMEKLVQLDLDQLEIVV